MKGKSLKKVIVGLLAVLIIAAVFMFCRNYLNSRDQNVAGNGSGVEADKSAQAQGASATTVQGTDAELLNTTTQTDLQTSSSASSQPNQQSTPPASQAMLLMPKLGAGINIGNDLDVKDVRRHIENPTIEQFESYWGNTPVTKEVFVLVKNEGFTTVRIPVSWSEHMDESHHVDSAWMERVHEVVDMALDSGLYVILDIHHETFITPTYDKEEEVKEILIALWQQIAAEFADYDDRLLFEGMNEPRLEGTKYEWTEGTEESRQVINSLNKAFVDTVRASGDLNEKRYLLIGAYGTSSYYKALTDLEIPDDDHILVAIHIYSPYDFTSNSGGANTWSDSQDSKIKELGNTIEDIFISKGVPVVITEFGCQKKADEAERIKWLTSYMETFAKRDIPCIWWDNGNENEYRIIDRINITASCQDVITTMTEYYK